MLHKEDLAVIKALNQCGVYQQDIAAQLGVHPKTVSRALRPDRSLVHQRKPRGSKLDLYKASIDRLLDPVLLTGRGRMPDPVISFEKMNVKVLAAYTLVRNPQGLLYEITMNTAHILDGQWRYGQWDELETLLHEQVHLWQQNLGAHPVKPGRAYHNRDFVDNCESLGLHPMMVVGCHIKPADGVFELLMREHGIARPEPEPMETEKQVNWWDLGKERRGQSTLSKWSCGCQNVRVGTKEFHAQCLKCGNVFVNSDGVSATAECSGVTVFARSGISLQKAPEVSA